MKAVGDTAKKARILLWDCETAPNLAYVWGKYQQDVIDFKSQGYMLCFAYKWLGEKKIHVVGLPHFKRHLKEPENDIELISALHKLFSEADVVIAHNGNSFDQKVASARFIVHGLNPPAPYKQIDTKLIARRYFRFNSNSLDDLGKTLGLGRKLSTGGWALWKGCLEGDAKSWKKMMAYNKQDVALLEEVYLKLRPWMTSHPGLNIIENRLDACPKCGSTHLQSRGTKPTQTAIYRQYQCMSCGGWSRQRQAEKLPKVSFVN